MDQEPAHRHVPLVPVQNPDTGAPLLGLPSLEVPAEGPVGGGAKRHREGQE